MQPQWPILCVFAHQLSQLKKRLEEAEAERDKLLEELKAVHGIGASDSEDLDEMLDFPGMRSKYLWTFPSLAQSVHALHAGVIAVPLGYSYICHVRESHWFIFVFVSFELSL